ncbi:hypothetical protein [Pontibacillus litoralis]|uniref:Uncharacterized protein n=1 Tax=Pontibacillus litoralis JSM 072002 TaxID=1385512 RepID=A0A0A5GAX2_9BACI|nr:hypothetical protein [Pontibacillus litoralis]KGX88265.1 hypothetical protein N784_10565 [Pontibacillus litoralis JSM 072002]
MAYSRFEIEQSIEGIIKELNRIKGDMHSVKAPQSKKNDVFSYFVYSVIFPYKRRNELMVFGSFIVMNNGPKKITKPIIEMNISPVDKSTFAGKIYSDHHVDYEFTPNLSEAWCHVDDDNKILAYETGQYKLRPLLHDQLGAGDKLAFSNFQLSVHLDDKIDCVKVEGGIYYDENPSRFPSLNNIYINL